MKILAFGDIYGRIGRAALKKELPLLLEKYKPDCVIGNIDNISSGRGALEKHINEMNDIGVDIMTGGDHICDNINKIEEYLQNEKSNVLRPDNFYSAGEYTLPGKGYRVYEKNGKKLLLIHVLGEVFIKYKVSNPFLRVQEILEMYKSETFDAIIIDFHKETTAEGYGMSFLLDGKVSLVFGTHTHIQTNDDQVLPKGTGMISDIGMVGPSNSIIGAEFESVKSMFLVGVNRCKIEQSLDKDYVVGGIYAEIRNMSCVRLEKINIRSTL